MAIRPGDERRVWVRRAIDVRLADAGNRVAVLVHPADVVETTADRIDVRGQLGRPVRAELQGIRVQWSGSKVVVNVASAVCRSARASSSLGWNFSLEGENARQRALR